MFKGFFPETHAVYEIMWKKYCKAKQATNDEIIRRISFACWIPKATKEHSEYVILIAFPLQQWLHEGPQFCIYTHVKGMSFQVYYVASPPRGHKRTS